MNGTEDFVKEMREFQKEVRAGFKEVRAEFKEVHAKLNLILGEIRGRQESRAEARSAWALRIAIGSAVIAFVGMLLPLFKGCA